MNEQTEYLIDCVLTYLELAREQYLADDESAFDMAREMGHAIDALLKEGVTDEQIDKLFDVAIQGLRPAQQDIGNDPTQYARGLFDEEQEA